MEITKIFNIAKKHSFAFQFGDKSNQIIHHYDYESNLFSSRNPRGVA